MVMTIFVILVEIGEILLIEHYIGISLRRSQKISIIAGSLMVTFMISAIYFSVGFFLQWKEYVQLTQALEKANLEARYDTLRNQVNPHFLFNSLNTLLTLVDDNPAASRYVSCIADIMRYMLQSRDKEVVLLRDELNIARDYVYIQQMRFGERLKIDFDVPEKFYHYAIPPLALQMLLENALKHNVVSHEHPLSVKIHVADGAFLTIENTIKPRIDKEPSTGVGLENIRNRYIFLSGKEIQVKNQNNTFSVSLPLFEKPI
jgi:LytS/YehU family sensor histidine kinase